MKPTLPSQLPQWQKLQQLAQYPWSLTQLFADQSDRARKFSVTVEGIYFDYSKQCLDQNVKEALIELANACDLKQKIARLYQGDKVNSSEDRAALHTALRLPKTAQLSHEGVDVVAEVHDSLEKAAVMVDRIRNGIWRGYSGKAITDVVNIGVGGSDLGPVMTSTALDEWADSTIKVHFVSNMDGTQLGSLLERLNPETTLFIISSKSFGTVDTLTNAQTARAWLFSTGASQATLLRRHFIGISANPERVSAWGIPEEHQLKLWDWVGGRFSMWSAIGLAVAIRIGTKQFNEMLQGAYAMDQHFAQADFEQNLPILLGLIGVWNSTFLEINAHTVLPYDGRLKYFPSYLTQLEMESNGKSVTHDGQPVSYATCPILWGEIGSNAQHAFYQLLHQGTQKVSCDFIACVNYYQESEAGELKHQHALSLANCLAQSRVLAFGNDALAPKPDQAASDLDKFKRYRGNQPSTTILLDELTPRSFGALIALYEHKVFVMASIWDINPFDQWGVEMGKQVANEVFAHIQLQKSSSTQVEDTDTDFDSSTEALLQHINKKIEE
ncbi:glucose-6-phosphate isomerase [Psychrobacter sanguinis]|uniref:glucose-6-phosphate isomerase n=1 Tax=Psychrobacter sanguinis TaxID=861445 RepID=UPI00191A3F55|nr:glucose-6-phosphate isomerase [Psychrobacter sanguinis]MCC3345989.1 glucose-6-phosphate isomerase [Psychrobacter sanguinis]